MTVEMEDPLNRVMRTPIEMARVVSGLHGGNIQIRFPFLVAGPMWHAPRCVAHPQKRDAVAESQVAPVVADFQNALAWKTFSMTAA